MFIPTGTKNGPIISELSGTRSTKVDYCDGTASEVVMDDWLSVQTQQRCLKKKWTGCTIFPIYVSGRDVDPPIPVDSSSSDSEGSSDPKISMGPYVKDMFDILFETRNKDKVDKEPRKTNKCNSPVIDNDPACSVVNHDAEEEEPSETILNIRTKIALHPELIDVATYQSRTVLAQTPADVSKPSSSDGPIQQDESEPQIAEATVGGHADGEPAEPQEEGGYEHGRRLPVAPRTNLGSALEEDGDSVQDHRQSHIDGRYDPVHGYDPATQAGRSSGGVQTPSRCRRSGIDGGTTEEDVEPELRERDSRTEADGQGQTPETQHHDCLSTQGRRVSTQARVVPESGWSELFLDHLRGVWESLGSSAFYNGSDTACDSDLDRTSARGDGNSGAEVSAAGPGCSSGAHHSVEHIAGRDACLDANAGATAHGATTGSAATDGPPVPAVPGGAPAADKGNPAAAAGDDASTTATPAHGCVAPATPDGDASSGTTSDSAASDDSDAREATSVFLACPSSGTSDGPVGERKQRLSGHRRSKRRGKSARDRPQVECHVPSSDPDGDTNRRREGDRVAEGSRRRAAGIDDENRNPLSAGSGAIDPLRVYSLSQVQSDVRRAVIDKYSELGQANRLVLTTDASPKWLSGEMATFLGTVGIASDPGHGFRVYRATEALQHDDVFLSENATLEKQDRQDILHSVSMLSNEQSRTHDKYIYCPGAEGYFQESEFHIMSDNNILDLSVGFEFHVEADRKYSLNTLHDVKPRLIILSFSSSRCEPVPEGSTCKVDCGLGP